MVMATSGITASLFWAQSEWAGPRRHHAASLKSPSLSTAAMALVLPWLVVPPCWGDASSVFLCQCLQITGVICTEDVQCWRNRAIQTQRDHLHCKYISKDNVVQAISAAYSWAFVWSSSGNTGNGTDNRSFA